MTAPVSVVIPTCNSVHKIGPMLGILVAGASDGLIAEVLFADGGSSDALADLADHAGAEIIQSEPGRGAQLRAGCAAARGDWLLILHDDTQLQQGWIDAVRAHVNAGPDRAGVFALRFDAVGFGAALVGGWANFRTRCLGMPYGDQGLLISQKLYREIGGYQPIAIMEDVAIIRKLGKARLRVLDAVALTSAARYQKDGWLMRSLRNWACLMQYFLGRSPEKIARVYQKSRS